MPASPMRRKCFCLATYASGLMFNGGSSEVAMKLATRSRLNSLAKAATPGSRLVAMSSQTLPRAILCRNFSATPLYRRTVTIHVPPDTDLASSPTLDITAGAAARLITIAQRENNPNLALRIQVRSGGCHGFEYVMSLVTLPPLSLAARGNPSIVLSSSNSSAGTGTDKLDGELRDDDSVFAFVKDNTTTPTSQDQATRAIEVLPKIVLDGTSLQLLKGSKVDFTQELIGSRFMIIDNPLATASCGCGASFSAELD